MTDMTDNVIFNRPDILSYNDRKSAVLNELGYFGNTISEINEARRTGTPAVLKYVTTSTDPNPHVFSPYLQEDIDNFTENYNDLFFEYFLPVRTVIDRLEKEQKLKAKKDTFIEMLRVGEQVEKEYRAKLGYRPIQSYLDLIGLGIQFGKPFMFRHKDHENRVINDILNDKPDRDVWFETTTIGIKERIEQRTSNPHFLPHNTKVVYVNIGGEWYEAQDLFDNYEFKRVDERGALQFYEYHDFKIAN